MSKPHRADLWHKENPSSDFIPYSAQVDHQTVKTLAGDYVQVIRLEGVAHESADDRDIDLWRDQLNGLLKNIASPQVALWMHTLRRVENTFPAGDFPPGFARDLNDKYSAYLANTHMMVNELYVTVIYRPHPNKTVSLLSRWSAHHSNEGIQQQTEALEKLHDLVAQVCQGLQGYRPNVLSTYQHKGCLCSEPLEFLAFLINGEWQRFPLPKSILAHTLATSRIFFGEEALEIRMPIDSSFGAVLAIKEYPESTEPGLLNTLLSAPFPFVLSQSFTFLSKPVATELLLRQQKRMVNAGDLAESQIQDINTALDDLTAGRFVMGEHHLTLMVLASDMQHLKEQVAATRAALTDCSMVVAREDLALEAAYWSQLPGNFKYRPRPAPITSRNLAGFASLHNYPSGCCSGNPWGPAVTLFKTASGAPYYFNFHEPSHQADQGQQEALAKTVIIGPSGSGKTVVQAFTLAQAQKFSPTCFVFDKDQGLEIFIRAMGGVYLPLKNGKPTGFNPFQLEPTEHNLLFLQALVKKLVEGNHYQLSVKEEREIANAVQGVMTGLKLESRSLRAVLSFLDQTHPEGAGARLQRWCDQGALAWVFDNEADQLHLQEQRLFGFDITDFLDNAEIRTPVVMYLFHRMEQLIDGRRFICFLDEFWKMLLDPYFEEFAHNKLKVIRKQNGFLVMGTQSARDVLQSPIAHSIIEQSATLIFLPNPKADAADYIQGFKGFSLNLM